MSQLRLIIRRALTESLSDWNPSVLPSMFDAVFQKHALLRNDPQVEPFSGRGGPMFRSFRALQRAGRAADQISELGMSGDVETHRVEAMTELETARDAILEILEALDGWHEGLQDLLSSMSKTLNALDISDDVHVPSADVGDLYEPL